MVCFDLDGTIADTIPMCIEAFRKAMSPYVGHMLSDNEIIQTFGMNEIGMVKSVTGNKWKLALKEFYTCYKLMHSMCMAPFQGIQELMEELSKRNILVTMITGKGFKSCNITINKLKLNNYFSECITGSEKGCNKTEGIIYLLEKYNLSSDEFIYIGDTISDIIACKNANVLCLSAAWAKSADLNALKAVNFDRVFTNISDLREFINEINSFSF
jgi:phosphoglycolate phosphatase